MASMDDQALELICNYVHEADTSTYKQPCRLARSASIGVCIVPADSAVGDSVMDLLHLEWKMNSIHGSSYSMDATFVLHPITGRETHGWDENTIKAHFAGDTTPTEWQRWKSMAPPDQATMPRGVLLRQACLSSQTPPLHPGAQAQAFSNLHAQSSSMPMDYDQDLQHQDENNLGKRFAQIQRDFHELSPSVQAYPGADRPFGAQPPLPQSPASGNLNV
ncbi:hypothetical protein F5Y16DRAFT_396524 [Xylariaceae sp. FL0255]|nr:hypothetical protein F5Y16DRAFT_396524 [Xylariaceae sp. FL0255]